MLASEALDYGTMSDPALAGRVAQGDTAAARLVISRNNQGLFRAAWAILKNRAEAEEALQEAYLKAFRAIGAFQGASSLRTWLTRIVVNEALTRRRAAKRQQGELELQGVTFIESYKEALMEGSNSRGEPERSLVRKEVAGMLERAIAKLPDALRLVFVMREIEDLSVDETAEALEVLPQTVKTRLFRARRRLRVALGPELRGALTDTFRFDGGDCEALTDRVLAALALG